MAAKREWCENSQGHRHNLGSRAVHTPRFAHGQGLCRGRHPHTVSAGRGGWLRRDEQEQSLRVTISVPRAAQVAPQATVARVWWSG